MFVALLKELLPLQSFISWYFGLISLILLLQQLVMFFEVPELIISRLLLKNVLESDVLGLMKLEVCALGSILQEKEHCSMSQTFAILLRENHF